MPGKLLKESVRADAVLKLLKHMFVLHVTARSLKTIASDSLYWEHFWLSTMSTGHHHFQTSQQGIIIPLEGSVLDYPN